MYNTTIAAARREKKKNLTLNDLEEEMRDLWRITYGEDLQSDDDEEEDREIALNTFDGICYECGKKGHRARDCPSKDNNDGTRKGRFNGKCHECGKVGHRKDDCWMLEKNASKRPAWYKTPDQVAGAIDEKDNDNTSEYLLNGIKGTVKFPKTKAMLLDENVWVADTGASTHSTPHSKGMTNIKKVKSGIMTAQGKANSTRQGDIPGIICDKEGNQKKKATAP